MSPVTSHVLKTANLSISFFWWMDWPVQTVFSRWGLFVYTIKLFPFQHLLFLLHTDEKLVLFVGYGLFFKQPALTKQNLQLLVHSDTDILPWEVTAGLESRKVSHYFTPPVIVLHQPTLLSMMWMIGSPNIITILWNMSTFIIFFQHQVFQ